MAQDCPLTDNIFKLPAPAWFDQELFKRLTGFCKAFLKLEAFYPLKKKHLQSKQQHTKRSISTRIMTCMVLGTSTS